jgi:hypothetical protein
MHTFISLRALFLNRETADSLGVRKLNVFYSYIFVIVFV